MKLRKLATSAIVSALTVVSLSAVAFAGNSKPLEIEGDFSGMNWGFIVGSYEHVFYQKVDEGIRLGCTEIGLTEDQFNITDCNLEADKAINAIQNFTANKVNAIALACNDAAGCVPGINEAAANGVAMFNFDSKADDLTNVISFVGTDNFQGGVLGGEELIRLSKEGDTVAIIGNPESVSTLDRENGALQALEGSGRTVLSGYNYEGDANRAQEIMETILVANPDCAAVFCAGDPAATGAMAAIKAAGSNCLVVGFDGNPEALEAMLDAENGKTWVSEIAQDPIGIGRGIVEQMAKYFTTGEVDDQVIMIDPYIITAENAADELAG
ncbi:MAG: substrate-binding domain-containing protein [Eubacteriales bacterium]|nr:substrate-binding domain-containing protein [Eubacteriales bacterium]